jgi:hypothetical protein
MMIQIVPFLVEIKLWNEMKWTNYDYFFLNKDLNGLLKKHKKTE